MKLSKICCIGILLCLGSAAVSAADPHPALVLVQKTTDQMLTQLRAEREKLNNDPTLVNQLVEKIVLPHFDFEAISASVLGKYWRRADADQQRRFREAFKLLLLRTYATALVDNMDKKIEFEPVRAAPGATDVTVRTTIPQSGEFPMPVNYSMELIDKQWKVYDVEIDGLSLVANYRSTFAKEINKSGLEGLIKVLEKRNKELSS
ncbi:MAG: ABC transporter substrate-binding protein [Gammaproteobacteria bacterium]|jgi:phospholipid transport system substrate-binding protein